METRWLEGFVAVAEELHFGRAAERLHLAQSPLSQTIRRLEAELGERLFVRSTRSVALTPAGAAFLPHAYRVLDDLRSAAEAARSAAGSVSGRLSIGFSGMHNHETLPLLARSLRRDYPNIDLALEGGVRTYDGMRLVRGGKLDLAFVGLLGEPDPDLAYRVLARRRLGVVVSSEHRLAEEGQVAIGELRHEPFVMNPVDGTSSLSALVAQTCQAAGFAPVLAQVVGDPFLVLSLVSAEVGVTMMTSEILPVLPPHVRWLELAGDPIEFVHGIVWKRDRDSDRLTAAIEVLDDVFPRH